MREILFYGTVKMIFHFTIIQNLSPVLLRIISIYAPGVILRFYHENAIRIYHYMVNL